jgi:predicted DCC family thiol-disulfide oxidoreductase YuxK
VDDARPVLIYDGDCGFCVTSAEWVSRRWSGADAPTTASWQQLAEDGRAELQLTRQDLARSAWWCDGVRLEEGSRAVAYALMATDGPWAVVGRILLVPPVAWVAPSGYRLVARYRHLLPGGTPACRV